MEKVGDLLKLSQDPVEDQGGVDLDELEKEVAQILFDENDTTAYGTKSVVFEGVLQRVHNSYHFTAILGMYQAFISGKMNDEALRSAYKTHAAAGHLLEIFAYLENTAPQLYKKMADIISQKRPDSTNSSPAPKLTPYAKKLLVTEQAFYSSKAYSLAAQFARRQYKNYDLGYLYEA
ncbi:hypothetical protein HYW36_02375 [Candidatus Saccharibacteria bacterium]|nr:hypothetical protein [Candidatus Saccharibacteria bacterium]